jgi:hypothetical protein
VDHKDITTVTYGFITTGLDFPSKNHLKPTNQSQRDGTLLKPASQLKPEPRRGEIFVIQTTEG